MLTKRFWYSLAVLFLTAAANAAVVVQFARPADYRVWLADAKGAVLSGPVSVKGERVVLESGKDASKGGWTLVAVNSAGNAALVPVPAGAEPKVTVAADGFTRIGRVHVTVVDDKGGRPDVAAVTLTDGKGKATTAVIGAADNGVAQFEMVASGDGSVRVQQGNLSNAQTITVRLPLEHPEPLLEVPAVVTLPDGMKTLSPGGASKDSSGGVPAASGSGDRRPAGQPESDTAGAGGAAGPAREHDAGKTAGAIIGLFLLAAVGWLGYNYLKGKGVTAEGALAKAGIGVEPDGSEVATVLETAQPALDPNVCPFCGQTKDPVTGACACTLTPGSVSPVPPTPSARGARLVALTGPKAGSVWRITGTLSIGRDPSQDLAIAEDTALSRRHATLQVEDDVVAVVDQGSSNGTFVNGQKVMRQALRPGDELVMGGSRFRYEV